MNGSILDNIILIGRAHYHVQNECNLWTTINMGLYKSYRYTLSYIMKSYKKPAFIGCGIALLLTGYVIMPMILSSKDLKKYSKRPDKYTTGFTNSANDCFANSTVQALVPLWRLKDYFEQMAGYKLPDTEIKYPMPLHLTLLQLMKQMQTPINANESISVWNLLHKLEQIHQGKISRAQHDAHELFQMLVDTLEEEYLRFFSFYFKLKDEKEREALGLQIPPHFPFSSIIESKLCCMRCKFTSAPARNPMVIWELNVAQDNTSAVSLDDIIRKSWNEVIGEYSCLVCNVKYMLINKDSLIFTPEQEQLLANLKELLANGSLKINDEAVENPLYKEIISSNEVFRSPNMKTVIYRTVSFVSTSEILVIHLSRSIFEDLQTWRNSKIVQFNDTMELNGVKYTLRSMIRHQGSHSSGHYECYRRKPVFYKIDKDGVEAYEYVEKIVKKDKKVKKLSSVSNKPFWRISDTRVTETSLDYVLNDGKAVYMLVYEQTA